MEKPIPSPAAGLGPILAAVERAELYRDADPPASGFYLRIFVERCVHALCSAYHLPVVHNDPPAKRLARLREVRGVSADLLNRLDALREVGNHAVHDRTVEHIGARLTDARFVVAEFTKAEKLDPGFAAHIAKPPSGSQSPDELHVGDPDGIYLVRDVATTSAVRVRAGAVTLIADRVERLLFGEGQALWEWQRYSDRTPVDGYSNLHDFWDSLSEPDNRKTTWVPVEAARLIDLRSGRVHPQRRSSPLGQSELYDEDLGAKGGVGVMTTDSQVSVFGSVGPYVLQYEYASVYAGGAHGLGGGAFSVFDTVKGEEVNLVADVAAAVRARGNLIERAWKTLEPESQCDRDDLEVTLFHFRFRDGKVYLDCQVTAETCYAHSDGRWHDYTHSTFVPLDALPDALLRYRAIPEVVEWFRRRDPIGFAGWSVLDLDLGDIVETQLHGSERFA
jgi:hypothetical protein